MILLRPFANKCFYLGILFITFFSVGALSQSCSYTPGSGLINSWSQFTQVSYYIDSNFPDTSAPNNAVNNWAASTGFIQCSLVNFVRVDSPSTAAGSYNIYFTAVDNELNTGTPRRGSTDIVYLGPGGRESSAVSRISKYITNSETITQVTAHEIGHTFGLNDCRACGPGTSVMVLWGVDGSVNINAQGGLDGPNVCDNVVVAATGAYACSPPPPPPPPDPDPGGGLPPCDPFTATEPCPDPKDTGSPIIIDILHKGFHLTSAEDGVMFDIAGVGKPIKMGWTAPGSYNAFLALPNNGSITSGKELFGNFTPQPFSHHPNGFLALAEYDKMVKGGNGDGIIDAKDAIYSSLRLWIDENHDGMAQPNEIHTLPEMGVFSISLRYVLSAKKDRFGNAFRFRGRINVTDQQEDESKDNRIIYDVFFAH